MGERISPGESAARRSAKQDTESRNAARLKNRAILTIAGIYILGFPADTPERSNADIAIIKKELPIDLLEFLLSARRFPRLGGSPDRSGKRVRDGLRPNRYDVYTSALPIRR